ncbi:MAG TPA: hypothetical protein VGQ86_07540 [Candidatus Limnocylindria bacterium]|nr:hypothetical protein [Candidatus Limnocylindria bacterium]
MSSRARSLVAGIDSVIMGVAAYSETGGSVGRSAAELVLWGAAIAAAVCTVVVFVHGSGFIAWAAIGYVLFGALLTNGSPHWALFGLALALMPLVPRPRDSLAIGLVVAVIAALGSRYAIAALI